MILQEERTDKVMAQLKAILDDSKESKAVYSKIKKTAELAKFLDRVIECSDDGIFICDRNCIAIGANKTYEIMSGIPLSDIPGNSIEYLVKKYATSAASLKVRQTHRTNIIQYTFLRTGKVALVTSNPLFDKNGELTHIVTTLRDITELQSLKQHLDEVQTLADKYNNEILLLRNQLASDTDIIAQDKTMVDLLYSVGRIAKVNATVLITGETGVGKEVFAKYIYSRSSRSDKPFIKINCGALPESLIESELFGYVPGAFTGACKNGKVGLFEAADTGTIFLDEIGELSLDMQVKLLRVLQEKEIMRIGGDKPIPIDVRVIAATNKNLNEMVEKKQFRQDLYFRLNVIPITIPPVRERRGDIIPFVKFFLKKANQSYGFNKTFTNNTYQLFYKYDWPGNVREIKNIVERIIIMSDTDCISPNDISANLVHTPFTPIANETFNIKEILEKIEFDYMNKAYEKFGSIRLAAEYLDMTKPTFIRKRNQYAEKYSNADDAF